MWPVRLSLIIVTVTVNMNVTLGSAVTNSNFNEGIRDYSVQENNTSVKNATTLLQQGKERYTHFVPIPNPVMLKQEIPDNELSSSSYSRGLLHHSDYAVKDYEDGPYHGYDRVYNIHNSDGYGHHGLVYHSPVHFHSDHHGDHHDSHHHHIGHHRHYDHGLASKALLWPIAGIALLGAAALVTNPILLQLGVVSGRRKKRDTEELTGPDDIDIEKWTKDIRNSTKRNQIGDVLDNSSKNPQELKGFTRNIDFQNINNKINNSLQNDNLNLRIPHKKKFIPIPLKFKTLQ